MKLVYNEAVVFEALLKRAISKCTNTDVAITLFKTLRVLKDLLDPVRTCVSNLVSELNVSEEAFCKPIKEWYKLPELEGKAELVSKLESILTQHIDVPMDSGAFDYELFLKAGLPPEVVLELMEFIWNKQYTQ